MEPLNNRGYALTSLLKYVREEFDPARRERVLAKIPPETVRAAETAKPTEWYPAAQSEVIYDAIVEACDRDPVLVEEALVGVGKYTAQEATNSFLRLLMKVLTPALFAKKLPSLYERDNSRGKVTVDVEEDRVVIRIDELKGCKHVGVVSAGWATFALEAMGKKLSQRSIRGWSVDVPDPESVTIELHWRT